MSLFNRLIVNATSIYGARIIEGFLQLAVLSFILSQVGREYYAAALLIISIHATIDLARGGMQKATLKYIAEYEAKGDHAGANGILSSSSAIQGAVGMLGLLICLGISPYATEIFSLPDHMKNEAFWAICLLGAGVAISFSISPWLNSVGARERYDLLSLAQVLGKLFRAGLIVALLLVKAPGLISLVAATIAGNIFERLICICFAKKISPHLKLDIGNVSRHYINVLLKFSFFDFFHTLSSLLYTQGALFLAAHLISLKAVANLGIINNICSLVGIMMGQMTQMVVPVASRLQARGQILRLKSVVVRGTTVTVFAGGIVMAGLIPWIKGLLELWIGPAYLNLAGPAIVLISATFLVYSSTCIHNALGGIGRVAVDGLSSTVTTSLGMMAGVFMILFLGWGFMGLVYGLFFARALRFVFVSWYGIQVFQLPAGQFVFNGYFRAFFLIFVVSLLSILPEIAVHSWMVLLSGMGLTVLSYLLIGIFWVVEPVDRIRFFKSLYNGFQIVRSRFDGWAGLKRQTNIGIGPGNKRREM